MERNTRRLVVGLVIAVAAGTGILGRGVSARGTVTDASVRSTLILPAAAGGAYTCTQNGMSYEVGTVLCINHTPFKCVENRGWVKNGTNCQ